MTTIETLPTSKEPSTLHGPHPILDSVVAERLFGTVKDLDEDWPVGEIREFSTAQELQNGLDDGMIEYLNVSGKAISKWKNNAPPLTQILIPKVRVAKVYKRFPGSFVDLTAQRIDSPYSTLVQLMNEGRAISGTLGNNIQNSTLKGQYADFSQLTRTLAHGFHIEGALHGIPLSTIVLYLPPNINGTGLPDSSYRKRLCDPQAIRYFTPPVNSFTEDLQSIANEWGSRTGGVGAGARRINNNFTGKRANPNSDKY